MEARIGVYICHCGKNIAGTVNVSELRDFASKLPGVIIARDYVYMCSSTGQNLIKEDIKKLGINRVVIAACSPSMHLETFRRAVAETSLNKYLLEMSNIREQCSWVHTDPKKATEKAKRIIAMAIRKVSSFVPLEEIQREVQRKVLVIGGGIAGIHASIELAKAGYEVTIVDKAPTIGGKMMFFDKTFPTLDCAQCILAPRISEVTKLNNVKILTNSEVIEVRGGPGKFHVKILKKPRYVDEAKCVACGNCSEKCPVEVPNEWWFGLGKRKAIYIPFPQAYPNAYLIDPNACLRLKLKRDVCGLCYKACDRDAIKFDMNEEIIEDTFGAIIVAIGGEPFDASRVVEYGYGKFRNVITGIQFEILTNVAGPTNGEIIRPSDGKEPRTLVFIQCVGFRNVNYNEYCCRIGCVESIKHAIIAKEKLKDATIYICAPEIRAFGKGFEEFYKGARERGIIFIKGLPSELKEDHDGKVIVQVYDASTDKILNIEADLVILSTGLQSSKDHEKISEILRIPRSSDGFILEKHPKLDPTATPIAGIFVAGVAQGPKDIPDSVAHAEGAAARVISFLAKGELELEPFKAKVNDELCSKCLICVRVCPFSALSIEKEGSLSKITVDEALCIGCGICAAACPSGAITIPNVFLEPILLEIEGALRWHRCMTL
ncbi:MAG: CoB--CoM heterodisulfide reductase iron-sulfur subunit A family protein [Candidatus Korarchaeota archaeon]|nr:CoB--CoM heterodisulfide reductase iron-sulfur subunit A family protein [Thermoproteota archaeon]MCR8471978.1 CoB--CoM heterodisulfide reductase iron-sulfur subunit A family protein [Thermoproteota archaeon]